jgi:site-specific DNA-methyltransferase (adenine-specific)
MDLDRIIQGDSLEEMRKLPDKSIDLILCDLPYGVTKAVWDSIIPLDLLWEQYKRIIKDNQAIVLTAVQPFTSALIMSNPGMFKHNWVWIKKRTTGFLSVKYQPLRNFEDVLVFSKGTVNYYPQGLIRFTKEDTNNKKFVSWLYGSLEEEKKYIQEYSNYPKQTLINIKEEDKKVHPTQKPVNLFEYLIKTYSRVGDTVLDNTIGSGTTAVAAVNTGRHFIGIEMDEKYCGISNKRVQDARKEYKLFGENSQVTIQKEGTKRMTPNSLF